MFKIVLLAVISVVAAHKFDFRDEVLEKYHHYDTKKREVFQTSISALNADSVMELNFDGIGESQRSLEFSPIAKEPNGKACNGLLGINIGDDLCCFQKLIFVFKIHEIDVDDPDKASSIMTVEMDLIFKKNGDIQSQKKLFFNTPLFNEPNTFVGWMYIGETPVIKIESITYEKLKAVQDGVKTSIETDFAWFQNLLAQKIIKDDKDKETFILHPGLMPRITLDELFSFLNPETIRN